MNPVATTFFFYMLAIMAIVSAIAVITRRNPVHAALSLIVTLLSLAGFYLMLYAPFVAAVQIVLYAGGIVVLLLFVYRTGRGAFPSVFYQGYRGLEGNNTQQIGLALYGQYMLPFEIASLLLLVAIVGAVVMAKKRI